MPLTCSKVVVPVDFSGESPNAIRAGLQLAGDPQNLHLLHVLVPIDDLSPGVLLGEVTEETRVEHIRANLKKLADDNGASDAQQVVLLGTPGLEIADYATQQSADMIVIPSHGYHGVKRLVLGSVAERVIRHAECSVLVLRRSDAE
ncbi:MAG: universal stress protein [Planctomycetaceae bacterium]